MKILAIETSCDETALSSVDIKGDLPNLSIEIEEEFVATQIKVHREYGGVVPGLARREHEKNLPLLFEKMKEKNPDLLSVTVGPGLDPCLWSGINYAKEIKKKHFPETPLTGANHLEGHLYSFLLSDRFKEKDTYQAQNLESLFPAVALVVSGGHTILIHMKSMTEWEKLGETRDDAVGEAFDKVARLLDLSYPGGPEIEKLANTYQGEKIDLPEPMMNSGDYDFSYSGLKTAVLYYLKENPDTDKAKLAYSFQESAFAPLVKKTKKAAGELNANSILLSGGVAANQTLQKKLSNLTDSLENDFFVAPLRYNTDNATIIAVAAYINHLSGKEYDLESQPNLSL